MACMSCACRRRSRCWLAENATDSSTLTEAMITQANGLQCTQHSAVSMSLIACSDVCTCLHTPVRQTQSLWFALGCSTMLQALLQRGAPLKFAFSVANSVCASRSTTNACTLHLQSPFCKLEGHQDTHVCMSVLQIVQIC